MAASHVSNTSKEAGKSAVQAETRKMSHYEHLATSGFIVMPVANETLGSWSPLGMKFVMEIGARIKDTTTVLPTDIKNYIYLKLKCF